MKALPSSASPSLLFCCGVVHKLSVVLVSSPSSLRSLFEFVFSGANSFEDWSLEHVSLDNNGVIISIAISVTRDHHYQSYMANGDPRWLESTIRAEAANGVSMSG
ncbi:unnamed protein product [Eruca vesicaria subsp. sativa]|uniref:Uncharacterized protein n=1 Tax=Eruca vesicaria subsp. sativa TaxID=29727 RepID=A0ABC8L5T8_ERUVS|nr:unnamed protein product [Eruca vesicaria subsp. sativa]